VKLEKNDKSLHLYLDYISECFAKISISIIYMESENKVQAQNYGTEKHDWDILVNWSDDVLAIYKGIEKEIRKPFKQHGLDWCPCFKDIYRKDELPTVAVIGRKYFNRFGYMMYPEYESLYGDNEMEEVAKRLGRFEFIEEPVIFRHEHPNNTGRARDDMYEMNESPYYYQKDGQLFLDRKAINFGLK
jgi:hypothetical protein